MQSKEHFINAFYGVESRDIAALNSLIGDIETYLIEEDSDIQLKLILHTLYAYVADNTADDFKKCCEAAAPIIEILRKGEWELLELDILVSVLGYIASYSLTVELAQKALSILSKKFANIKHYELKRLRAYFNLSQRLLRAKCFDKVNPQELKAFFDQCVNSAIAICEKKGLTTLKTVLRVRIAVFYGAYNDILNGLKALEDTKDESWIKAAKDEVAGYLYHIDSDSKLSTKMHNFVVGHQIRRRRMERGMSTLDFADAIGSSQSAVNEFERGAKGVRGKRLQDIAKILDVDISYLHGDIKKKSADVVTDDKTQTINHLLSNMCDAEKQHVLDFICSFIKYGRAMNEGK